MNLTTYTDDELKDELIKRGYAVYRGKDMQTCITKLETMDEGFLEGLERIKKIRVR